jgi:EAL domain-containing protein (putative c-di-GMP-specific phosphodiesterase class I)
MLAREKLAFDPHIDFDFSFAFQPIVNAEKGEIISYEALVRGPKGEPATDVLTHLNQENLYEFDRACRTKAIKLASRLKLRQNLHINLLPFGTSLTNNNINATLKTSAECGFPLERIVFEISESETLTDQRRLIDIIKLYQDFNFQTAIDDFGTGYSGLNLLIEYQPNFVKLDRNLIANIHENQVKQTILQGIKMICRKLNIGVMAEGVEKAEEYSWLRASGVIFFQGFYFACPAFEALPEVSSDSYCV